MNRAVQPQRQQRRGIFSVPLADHPDLGVTEAASDMVVDQPTGLHKGITDCRADKLKAAFFNAFDSASEAGVVVGISASVAARVTCGALSTKDQTKSVNDSPFSSIAR